jgi:hypothetical protein
MSVYRDGERKPLMIGSHHLLEETFYCGNITLRVGSKCRHLKDELACFKMMIPEDMMDELD